MNIPHSSGDVVSPDQDPPDVAALSGKFEVKEILDPGRRRHQEYKDDLEKAKNVRSPQELLTGFTPIDSSVQEIFQLCCAETEKLKKKYAAGVRATLDLLFYVNLEQVFTVHETPLPNVSALRSCGWRSISFVKGQIACCCYAAADAPS